MPCVALNGRESSGFIGMVEGGGEGGREGQGGHLYVSKRDMKHKANGAGNTSGLGGGSSHVPVRD